MSANQQHMKINWNIQGDCDLRFEKVSRLVNDPLALERKREAVNSLVSALSRLKRCENIKKKLADFECSKRIQVNWKMFHCTSFFGAVRFKLKFSSGAKI